MRVIAHRGRNGGINDIIPARPYRILHVVNTLTVYGVPKQMMTVIRNYDRSAITPTVCSLMGQGQIKPDIEASGVEVIEMRMPSQRRSIIPNLKVLLGLVRIIRQRKIDIVRTHGYFPNLYGRYAAILTNAKCVVSSEHNQYKGLELKPKRRIIRRLLALRTNALVAVSEAVKADMVLYDRIPADKINVIYNGFDIDSIPAGDRTRTRRSLGIPEDVQVIGAIGRNEDQKGHRFLIEALSLIKDSHPKAMVLLIGDGKLHGVLKDYAQKMGVASRMIFAGLRKDIPDVLAAMDIYAMPSLWEGFGNALIEAMVASRPVVATSIGPFQEILTDGTDALLVPVKDSQALASAIVRLLDDPALAQALGRAARQRVIDRFGIKNTVAQQMELYASILNGRSLAR